MQTQIKKTIEKNGLISKGDKVVACVSGGPDSMALLHLLADLRRYYNIKLTVVHLDHMIRGRQSTADADFVMKAAIKLSMPFVAERVDVKKIAKSNRMSLEEAAREVRYDFYRRAAEKMDANKIATGHTLDDQAETVLMRLVKGSGSRGLSGIPYKRRLGDSWVIRPLLDVTRKDIEKYLKKNGIASRTDASNLRTFYLRNKIRRVLIPLLEKEFNPKIKENLNLIAENLSGEFNYLNAVARRRFNRLSRERESGIAIGVSKLLRQHVALQRLIVRQIIQKLKGDLIRITYRHWQEIESMLSDKDKRSVDLPDGIKVIKNRGYIIFTKGAKAQERIKDLRKVVKLNIPGEVAIPELGLKAHSEVVNHMPRFKKGIKRNRIEYINGDSVKAPLKIRVWRNGDRMKPLGMNYSKKLHDIFVDEKVPREIRHSIPLVISGKRIVWATGVKLSEDYKVKRKTERIIKLSIRMSP